MHLVIICLTWNLVIKTFSWTAEDIAYVCTEIGEPQEYKRNNQFMSFR